MNIQDMEGQTVRIRATRAFTLIEILVALSMIILILAAVYSSYAATTAAIGHRKPRSILAQQARLFLQKITCELRCCYSGESAESHEDSSNHSAGEEMIEQERTPSFVNKGDFSGHGFLRFMTTVVTLKQSYSPDGLVTVSYRLDESGTTLLRSERRYVIGVEDDENEEMDENWRPILSNVEAITFESFDGQKWHEEWDSGETSGLPTAVRIALVVEIEDAGSLSFVSCAHITCRGPQTSVETIQEITPSSGDS